MRKSSPCGGSWLGHSRRQGRSSIAHYKQLVASQPANPEDLPLGRAVFAKDVPAVPHPVRRRGRRWGRTDRIETGPISITLLSNVLDPSAVMAREYIPIVVVTTGGRVITGWSRNRPIAP